MKKRGYLLWAAGLLGLAVLCIAAMALVYAATRNRALQSRPLVLILSPVNHEQVRAGDGLVVHATARSQRGVDRIELWADGELLTVREGPESGPVSPLVLTAPWQSDSLGSHILLVRAIASDGGEGQATISVETVGEARAALGGHMVVEGETLESIAEQYGVSPEDLGALNPGMDPGGIVPGDELTVPGGSASAEEPSAGEGVGEPAPTGGDEPVPDGRAPGGFAEVVDLVLPEDWIRHARLAGETVSLRVEALSLQTDAAYEGLHCYIGLGGSPPRWYPDADGDQATDESFTPQGDGRWDLGEHLAGESALVIPWPGEEPISIDASCVGVQASGTDAVELGRLEMEIPPDQWDGVTRSSPRVSAEGSFSLEYRVGAADDHPHGIPAILDPTMASPYDLSLAPRGFGLYWFYYPDADDEPIDGFRIFLNGTALWVEPPESRTTDLPREWLFPPCGESFTFTVTAYRGIYPDGPESYPSNPVIIEPDPERCAPRWTAAFLTLSTYDLGGDGRYEDRSGDVGGAYGYFYANDQSASFDGRSDTWGDLGLSHNSEYVVDDITTSANWAGSGPAHFRVELAEGEALTLGFHIDDRDTGRCNDSDDPGCDELVCEGEIWFTPDLAETDEGTIPTRAGQGNCEVSYTLAPVAGSPSVEPGSGTVPLPWLVIDDLAIGNADQVRIHVRNTGSASWESRDLEVELRRPTGEPLARDTWEGFSLGPDETVILASPELTATEPVCVLLDPDQEVAQEIDALASLGILYRGPTCMDLPDLVITGVEYDPESTRELVTVQNQGEGTLDFRSVDLIVDPIEEGEPDAVRTLPGIYLAPGESAVLSLTTARHAYWFEGYTVTVDPDDEIAEEDNGNNSFTVSSGAHVELEVWRVVVPYPARNRTEFQLLASAYSAGVRRPLGEWTIQTDDLDPFYCDRHSGCARTFEEAEYHTEFDLRGDESLWITVFADLERPMEDDQGHTFTWMSASWEFTAEDDWGAGGFDPRRGCTDLWPGPGQHFWVLGRYINYDVTDEDQPWGLGFNLCSLIAED
jgi:hypothetical protein